MPEIDIVDSPQDFATAFGDALNRFLADNGKTQSDLVDILGLDKKIGRQRISNYCKEGKRSKPDAEFLYLACSKLPGFYFDYNNYRISAATLNGKGIKPSEKPAQQLTFEFERQFKLTRKQGTLDVKVIRPRGRIEIVLSLGAKAS